jgi:hypothetical protein
VCNRSSALSVILSEAKDLLCEGRNSKPRIPRPPVESHH